MNLQRLTDSLTQDEGERLVPYLDSVNLWTVGIGRCIERNPVTPAEWRWLLHNKAVEFKLSESGSQFLFSNDVRSALNQIKARCDFWDRLDDVRQNVLIELCFQLGIERLLGFNKMFAALRVGNFTEAAKEGRDSLWYRQTPARAEKLMRAMETGDWP